MPICRTCGQRYAYAGDGWDGECPECADKTFEHEEREQEQHQHRIRFQIHTVDR